MTDSLALQGSERQRMWELFEDIKRMVSGDGANVTNRHLGREGRVEAIWASLGIEEPELTPEEVRDALRPCTPE